MSKSYEHVAVVIVNWNGLNDTRELLKSFKRVKYTNFSIVIVDNGSKNNEAELLFKEFKGQFPNIISIRLRKNLGYAAGCSLGMMYAYRKLKAHYILVMNNDILVTPNFLNELVYAMKSVKTSGLASPTILCYPKTSRIFYHGAQSLQKLHEILNTRARSIETEGVSGCCFLVKSNVIKDVGTLDTRFFLTNYDIIDYSLRVKKRGFKLLYVPRSIIYHKYSFSGRASLKVNIIRKTIIETYCALLFYVKHAKWYEFLFFMLLYFLNRLKRLLEAILFNKEKRRFLLTWIMSSLVNR